MLRIWPFTLGAGSDSLWQNHFWEGSVREPWTRRDASQLHVVHALLAATTLRHSREQTHRGKPLVELPPRTTRWIAVAEPPNSSERFVRLWLEATAVANAKQLGRNDITLIANITTQRSAVGSVACLSLENVNTNAGGAQTRGREREREREREKERVREMERKRD